MPIAEPSANETALQTPVFNCLEATTFMTQYVTVTLNFTPAVTTVYVVPPSFTYGLYSFPLVPGLRQVSIKEENLEKGMMLAKINFLRLPDSNFIDASTDSTDTNSGLRDGNLPNGKRNGNTAAYPSVPSAFISTKHSQSPGDKF